MDGLTPDQITWPISVGGAVLFLVIYRIQVVLYRRNHHDKMKK